MRYLRFLFLSLLLAQTGMAVAADTVDINKADSQQLMQLDGIGAAKTAAIVDYREQNGPFESVDQLTEVDGIGNATLEANRDFLNAGSSN